MKRGDCGGITFDDLNVGQGDMARRGSVVELRYSLWLNHGEQVQENQPCRFQLGERRVIAALEYGVEGMRVGGERRVRAGPQLAYGALGVPGVIPADALIELRIVLLAVADSAPKA